MPSLARIVALIAAVSALAMPGTAAAQAAATIVLNAAGITHSDGATRGQLMTSQLAYADCAEDDVLSFPLVLSGAFTGYALETWTGFGCESQINRISAINTVCWLVSRQTAVSATNLIALHLRDILAGTRGTGVPTGTLIANTSSAVCEAATVSASAAQSINLYFFLVSDEIAETSVATATWPASFKLAGPPAPTHLQVSDADGRLDVAFDATASNMDVSENGFNAYCLPPPGAPAMPAPEDAGLGGDCLDSLAFHVVHAPVDQYLCGTAPKGSAQISALGLSNGDRYSVAVAAVDSYHNVGPLSAVACGTPEHSLSETSVKGCGPCSFSSRAAARVPFTLTALFGLTYLARRRRRRTRASASR